MFFRLCCLAIFIHFPAVVNSQIITTFAGTGSSVFSGEGIMATSAGITNPISGDFDKYGNYYFCDYYAQRVRKINTLGVITTVACNGTGGYTGDGGLAIFAGINRPHGIKVDTFGNLYIAQHDNNIIRRINGTTGIINTIAGTGVGAYSGDGGPATSAELWNPQDVAVDLFGNIYISDMFNFRIRKIDASGIITTYAGTGVSGYFGDGIPATDAQLGYPAGLAVDDTGNLYIADWGGFANRVRKVSVSGIITTVAGNGSGTYLGDGIPATSAAIAPLMIALGYNNDLFISDRYNQRVYKVDAVTGILHCVAGNGIAGDAGDGGPATMASLYTPVGVALDACDNIYIPTIGDISIPGSGRRIRKVIVSPLDIATASITPTPNDTICTGTPVTYTTSTAGISTPAHQWYVNGSLVSGSGSTYTYTPAAGDTVYCKLTGTASCSGNTVTRYSNGIKMVVNPTTPASLNITASPNDTVCTGTAVTCVASITGGGATPAYYWYVNGIPVTGTSAYTFTPITGDSVSCVMVSSATCPVPDDTLESHLRLTVLPYVTPSVSITSSISSEGFTCSGDTVSFVATAVNGGTTPGYQWKKNGVNVGAGSSSYIYSPADGDTVRCVLTSSEMCPTVPTAISNNVGPMAVMPLIIPSISLTASLTFEIGETVTVNATVTGTSSYNIKWYKNTSLVATTSTPVFTYTKTAGIDVITAMVIHSGSGCYDSATSAAISVAAPNLVETLQQPTEFSIYPNPAHDELTISGAASINTVAITNLLGQSYYNVITSTHKNQLVINIGPLPVGVYVLRVNGVYFRRFVRQ